METRFWPQVQNSNRCSNTRNEQTTLDRLQLWCGRAVEKWWGLQLKTR